MAPIERICLDSTVLRCDYEKLVTSLLHKVNYQLPELAKQTKLKANVEGLLRDLNLPEDLILRIQGAIGTAVCITHAAYSFLSPQMQQTVALYAAITIGIDDIASDILEPLRCYANDLVMGQTHGHVILDALTAWLKRHSREFGNFSGDMIVKATLDFISACYYEETEGMASPPKKVANFAEYFRYKSGDSEGFAFLLFPEQLFPEDRFLKNYLPAVPYIIEYMNFVNDILSFYKEEHHVGDRKNYAHTYAQSENVTVLRALEIILERSVKAFQIIETILDGDEMLQNAAVRFLHGYLAFHLGQRRYRLKELNILAVGPAKKALESYLH